MNVQKEIIIVSIVAILLPSTGQNVESYTATTITMENTSPGGSFKSGVTICKAYQCTGKEHCTVVAHDSFVCSCDKKCALYRDCCWTTDGNCGDRTKVNFNVTADSSGESCTYTHITALYTGLELRVPPVGYFMVATCPLSYPESDVKDHCHEELPLFSKRDYPFDEYINHVPVFDYKNKRTFKNAYCARCNDVAYKDMRFWQFITACDSSMLTSECDDVLFKPRPQYYDNATMLRKCVISDIDNCSSSSPYYNLCMSYSAVTTFNGITFRNPHCALCYDPSLSFPDEEICPYEAGQNDMIQIFSNTIPHVIPFDFSVFEETNVLSKDVKCSRGLFYNSSSMLCDFVSSSKVINLADCLCNSRSEITLKLTFNFSDSLNWQSARMMKSLKDATIRHFSTLSSNINYVEQQDGNILLRFRLQNSCFGTFEEFREAGDRFLQHLTETHGLGIELYDVTVNCSSCSPSASCQKIKRFKHSDVVLFTHDDMTSAKIKRLNRVYSDIAWDIRLQGVCINLTGICDRNITVKICDWLEERPLCPFLVLPNDSFSLEENENGTTQLLSDEIQGAIPLLDYVILSNGNACVCFRRLKERRDLIILILFYVFTSLSLLTLLLTFGTYCTFRNLRNLPGKITMNFVVSLFFAQVILLTSLLPTVNYTACHVIGILAHYLWLSTFLWMSIIAYDVSRTFAMELSSALSHMTNHTRKALVYLFIGWGIPCAYVAVCVLIQQMHIHNLEFAYFDADDKCWLSPDRANFILFGIPAILCLCFNYITFIFTVRGLHRAKISANKLKGQRCSQKVIKEELFLFLKVTV
ncbi:Adhesion G protein-coupled receptor L3 [Holothuria leucospilota]|uniref:Adhesion G protein-coupled receptor L3 n=1 Tax=Holothuria leucospilota TaxID=206669 RepID=A0A9Q0YFK9_HOLLE|nr:Adhesion G protein-coupled receptor L3 [Holothuria leucospilota]